MSTRTLNLCLWVQGDEGYWGSTCQAVPEIRVTEEQHDAAGLPRCPLCGRPMREMRRPALSGNEGKEPKND